MSRSLISLISKVSSKVSNRFRSLAERLPSMASKSVQGGVVSNEDWDKDWINAKDPPFHRKVYSPFLERFHSQVYATGSGKRIFVPLCGKTLDMVFLADNGYEVVGIEFSKIGVERFFEENGLTFTMTKDENLPLMKYQAEKKNIIIFQGDFFTLKPTVCGQFDGVWDRGSYVAVNADMRKAYVELLSSVLKPGGKVLLEAYDYDPTKYPGPPHFTTEENVHDNFGGSFDVEVLLVDKDYQPPGMKGLDIGFLARVFMLTRK